MKDLGQVHYKYIKHASTGSVFFVLVKKQPNLDIERAETMSGFRTLEIGTLLDKFANITTTTSPTTSITTTQTAQPTVSTTTTTTTTMTNNIQVKEAAAASREDFGFLVAHLRCFLDFNANKDVLLPRGLYVGFLKLQSNIDAVKVMVNFNVPNVLPSNKMRDNPNISK